MVLLGNSIKEKERMKPIKNKLLVILGTKASLSPSFFLSLFKTLLNFLQYCFRFMFCFFGHMACGILASRQWIEPASLALEDKVLSIGASRKSPLFLVYRKKKLVS